MDGRLFGRTESEKKRLDDIKVKAQGNVVENVLVVLVWVHILDLVLVKKLMENIL